MGDTPSAEAQLDLVSQALGSEEPSYQYLLARASAYRQRRQNAQALTAFAQAAEAAGEDHAADTEMLRAGADEGLRINHTVSFLSDYSLSPIFEDTTVYALDAQLAFAGAGTLPPPRSSLQSQWTEAYHLHIQGMPDAGGFFQVRNARGTISLPSANSIVNRDTWDYSFNFAVNPSFRLGDNVFNFSTGIQQTVRRDNEDPHDMDQNLFRQFVYMQTSSFFNWVSVRGFAIREAGPFTISHQHSRDLAGSLEFRVGRPWAKTAFITGWGARDEQFNPIIREFYYTSTYGGLEHTFRRASTSARSESICALGASSKRSMQLRRHFVPLAAWSITPPAQLERPGNAAYSRNMGFHAYDAVQTGFAVSYALPISRKFEENGRELALRYPIRFSAGLQQQSFFNFSGGNNQQFRPYLQISIF